MVRKDLVGAVIGQLAPHSSGKMFVSRTVKVKSDVVQKEYNSDDAFAFQTSVQYTYCTLSDNLAKYRADQNLCQRTFMLTGELGEDGGV